MRTFSSLYYKTDVRQKMMLFLCIPNSVFTPELLIAKQKWCEFFAVTYAHQEYKLLLMMKHALISSYIIDIPFKISVALTTTKILKPISSEPK